MGELNLVIGPMYSGKSTELLRIYNKYKRNYNILVINHKSDNKWYYKYTSLFYLVENSSLDTTH